MQMCYQRLILIKVTIQLSAYSILLDKSNIASTIWAPLFLFSKSSSTSSNYTFLTYTSKTIIINEEDFKTPLIQNNSSFSVTLKDLNILDEEKSTRKILLTWTQKDGDDVENKLVLFMGIDQVKFRKPVVPGDQIVMELTMLKARRSTFKMAGKAFVQGELVCEAEMMAAVVDR